MSQFRFSASYKRHVSVALSLSERAKCKDFTGKIVGRLLVLNKTNVRKANRILWDCICLCSRRARLQVTTSFLRHSITSSCGCVAKENLIARSRTHGATKHPLFKLWQMIKDRCRPDNEEKRTYYFDRGIAVCDEWLSNYPAFRDHMLSLPNCPATAQIPGKKLGLTIDRIRNNEGYKPGNVRWATAKQQGNNRSSNRPVEIKGETLNFKEGVEKHSLVSHNTVQFRTQKGWSFEKACLTPYLRTRA